MVWIESWDTFYSEAEKLFLEHPQHVSALTTAHIQEWHTCTLHIHALPFRKPIAPGP